MADNECKKMMMLEAEMEEKRRQKVVELEKKRWAEEHKHEERMKQIMFRFLQQVTGSSLQTSSSLHMPKMAT